MGLTVGTTLRITGNGPDEVKAVDALVALVDGGFGEV
ncbi:MAG: HPr family phosphocarrier protein [Eubacterium aggregans]